MKKILLLIPFLLAACGEEQPSEEFEQLISWSAEGACLQYFEKEYFEFGSDTTVSSALPDQDDGAVVVVRVEGNKFDVDGNLAGSYVATCSYDKQNAEIVGVELE